MTSFDLGPEADDADDSEQSPPSADEQSSTSDTASAEESTSSGTSETDEEESSENPREMPAFEFEETSQRQFYPRDETWREWEKARDGRVKPALVMDDVEDLQGRELHDAVLRLVNDHAEELADYVKDARGIDD